MSYFNVTQKRFYLFIFLVCPVETFNLPGPFVWVNSWNTWRRRFKFPAKRQKNFSFFDFSDVSAGLEPLRGRADGARWRIDPPIATQTFSDSFL